MKAVLHIIVFLFTAPLCAQNFDFEWTFTSGGIEDDRVRGMALDQQGNTYITGPFSESISIGGENFVAESFATDSYICKLDSKGQPIWTKILHSNSFDDFTTWALKVDNNNNLIIAGSFWGDVDVDPGAGENIFSSVSAHDIYVSKLDQAGNLIWAKTVGGSDWDRVLDLDLDEEGNIYMTGYFGGTVDFDPGSGQSSETGLEEDDIFVYKLNSDGSFAWVYTVPTEGPRDGGSSIKVIGDYVYTCGTFKGEAHFPTEEGTRTIDGGSEFDSFIIKMLKDGSVVWLKTIGDGPISEEGEVEARGLAIGPNGEIYICGSFAGLLDFDPGAGNAEMDGFISEPFLLKLNSSGSYVWSIMNNGFESEEVVLDNQGKIYWFGSFLGGMDADPGTGETLFEDQGGGADGFLTKLNSNGEFINAMHLQSSGSILPKRMILDEHLNITLGIDYTDDARVNPENPSEVSISNGDNDFLILRMGQSGTTLTQEVINEKLKVYPNPAQGQTSVSFEKEILNGKIDIVDLKGTLRKSIQLVNSKEVQIPLDLEPGIFFLELNDRGERSTTKLLIQ